MSRKKFRILSGRALRTYVKHHPKLARASARAHTRLLKIRVRVRHPRPKSVNQRTLALASHYVGTRESPYGSNRTVFGAWYGANGEPWCAIFVSYILSHVGRPFRESYVPHIVALARNRQGGLSTILFSRVAQELKAGNVVLACYDWPGESPGTADHVGFVEKVLSSSTFSAIEGNTSKIGSQSNGGEVCRQLRRIDQVQAFILVKS